LWRLSDEELLTIWRQTRRGMDSTLSFLRTNIGIESSDWIPSLNSLVPLVVYYGKKKYLYEKEENLLIFWYHSANIWGRYSSSAEAKLDQDLDVLIDKETGEIKQDAVVNLVKNCRRDVSDLIVDEEELIEPYQRSAFLHLLFAIIRKNRAKDWFNSIELSATNVGPDNKIELHHFFPRSVLKKKGFSREEYDDLSNIVFLSKRANRDIRTSTPFEYIKKYNVDHKRLLEQHIPINDNLWRIENYNEFIKIRRKMLTEAMNDYLKMYGEEFMERKNKI
ncbi:MAG: hypothetical protein N2Z79_01295, partial [Candidatus Omnitrophica bacterium]|nr:hypothetical protein [Candidatus Omnitrophota bacterium]